MDNSLIRINNNSVDDTNHNMQMDEVLEFNKMPFNFNKEGEFSEHYSNMSSHQEKE